MTTIDPKFIEKAQELAFAFSPGQSTDLRHTIAIARALQDARDEENRECENLASLVDSGCLNCCGAGYFGMGTDCRTCNGTGKAPPLTTARAIAARRGQG